MEMHRLIERVCKLVQPVRLLLMDRIQHLCVLINVQEVHNLEMGVISTEGVLLLVPACHRDMHKVYRENVY